MCVCVGVGVCWEEKECGEREREFVGAWLVCMCVEGESECVNKGTNFRRSKKFLALKNWQRLKRRKFWSLATSSNHSCFQEIKNFAGKKNLLQLVGPEQISAKLMICELRGAS